MLAKFWYFARIRPRFFLSSVYIFICILTLLKTGGVGDLRYTTDFSHYHAFWHRYFPSGVDLSDKSKLLFQSSVFVDPEHRTSWMPNPFYSVIALFPLALWGSIALINIFGILVGVFNVCLSYLIARRLFGLGDSLAICSVLVCILNKWFIKESIGLTTMSLVSFFSLVAVTRSRYVVKCVFYLLAFMVRPNYLLFYFPLAIMEIVNCRRSSKGVNFFRYMLPLFAALPWIVWVDSNYPGNAFNYLFLSKWMGFDFASNYFPNGLSELGLDPGSVLEWTPSPLTFVSALADPQALNYVVSLWSLKLLSVLGFRFEEMFITAMGGYFSEAWGTLYAFFVSMPAFFSGILYCLKGFIFSCPRSVPYVIASVAYLMLTALLVGVPRYQLLVMPFLVPCLFSLCSGMVSSSSQEI